MAQSILLQHPPRLNFFLGGGGQKNFFSALCADSVPPPTLTAGFHPWTGDSCRLTIDGTWPCLPLLQDVVNNRPLPVDCYISWLVVVDVLWSNFFNPEFMTKFKRKVLFLLEIYSNFPVIQYRISRGKPVRQISLIDATVLICYQHVTHKHTHTRTEMQPESIASRR